MTSQSKPWASDRPLTSPFITPAGLRGWLAGRFMLRSNRQDEVLRLLDVQPGDRVLEIGHGPGGLLRLLDQCGTAALVHGVEHSPTMRDLATRVNREAVRAGRIRLTLGSADRTGLPDASFDRIVSVNTVALWPDLDAGIAEVRRVVAPPAGTVLLAWHGGHRPPSLTKRNLRLPPELLSRLRDSLEARFARVEHEQTSTLEVFTATAG